MTRIVETKSQARAAVAGARAGGAIVGLVPTMGALHDGHLSLVKAARDRCDFVAVSIFVNPTQFAPGEDYERYPRDLDADAQLLGPLGVDLVFAPAASEMYAGSGQTTVVPGDIAARWEGERRPGHFEGVATVVTKLFNVLSPDVAFFGEKDYQQLKVIEQLVRDVDLPVEIVTCPIVRDADGLALSSRNAYLTPAERASALAIPAALDAAEAALDAGELDGGVLGALMAQTLCAGGVEPDYAVVVDTESLVPVDAVRGPVRALIVGKVGTTRLLDNRELVPRSSE